MKYLPQLCGACDHPHSIPGCSQCACTVWLPHAAALDDIEAQEQSDAAWIGGEPLIGSDAVIGICDALAEVETDIHALAEADPTGQPSDKRMPLAVAVGLGPATEHDGLVTMRTITSDIMELPAEAFQSEGGFGPDDALQIAARWLGDPPELPTVAWGFALYGTARPDMDSPARAAHLLCAVDIDGRTYTAFSFLDDGAQRKGVQHARGWARLLRGELTPESPDIRQILEADGLRGPHLAAAHLMLLTRHIEKARKTHGQ